MREEKDLTGEGGRLEVNSAPFFAHVIESGK
jgi:hypothetical protein